jgi:hypothetical protein
MLLAKSHVMLQVLGSAATNGNATSGGLRWYLLPARVGDVGGDATVVGWRCCQRGLNGFFLSNGALQADDGQDVFAKFGFFLAPNGGFSASMKQLQDWGGRQKGIGHVSLSGGGIGGIIPRWDDQHLSLINQLLVLFVKKLVCRGTQNVLSGFGVSRQP